MTDWRLIIEAGGDAGDGAPPPARGARNMAVDHALLESAQQGGPPTLRLYRWSPACFSLGRNQAAAALYDPARIAALGLDLVRRPTGGLGVLHDDELTYSVTAPLHALGGARAAYRQINEALLSGLRRLGVPAEAAAHSPEGGISPTRGAAHPCFGTPAAGELVARGGKLVGSAQRCERRALLQHGSLLRSGSQARIFSLQRGSPDSPSMQASATLEDVLGEAPGWAALCEAVIAGFRDVFGICLARVELSADEEERAGTLEAMYADAAWTWRL